MASTKKKAAKEKPSKLQSLKKMILGAAATPKAGAGKGAKALGKASKAPPAKATAAKGASKSSTQVSAKTPAKVPAQASKKAAAAAPMAKASGKKAVASGKSAPASADSAAKNLLNGKAGKASAPAKASAPKGGARAAVRMYMETGTLLLGNPDGACREIACENQATTAGYCRAHYIKNWKKIKHKEQILREGRLNQYLDELIAKYPDKYIEAIKQDLASEKDFAKVITDLDLDETSDDFDVDQEPMENIIDTIKRDFEDEGEAF
jgi:hypothetical protein